MGDEKFSQYGRGYLSLAVNVLQNTPKISCVTKWNIFEIRFSQGNEKYDESALMHILQEFVTL